MKTLGIGIVGARYGARMHLANYTKLPRDLVELRGVCSRTKESAALFAKEAQIAFITDDYDLLLARKDIDVAAHGRAFRRHLKQWEGQLRLGKGIRPVSLIADVANLIHSHAFARAREAGANQWITANPVDVENWANLVIAFEDGSRATVIVSDVGLGGLNTRVTVFMRDGVIQANMTANDAIETYTPDASVFHSEYFTEKLETKGGWNRPSCDEDWFRGFSQEIADFISAIHEDREPRSGIDLAVECVNVIYAAISPRKQALEDHCENIQRLGWQEFPLTP